MKTLLLLAIPWSLIGAAFLFAVQRVRAWRREDRQREVLRRRVNREIDHPSTWNGGNAA